MLYYSDVTLLFFFEDGRKSQYLKKRILNPPLIIFILIFLENAMQCIEHVTMQHCCYYVCHLATGFSMETSHKLCGRRWVTDFIKKGTVINAPFCCIIKKKFIYYMLIKFIVMMWGSKCRKHLNLIFIIGLGLAKDVLAQSWEQIKIN